MSFFFFLSLSVLKKKKKTTLTALLQIKAAPEIIEGTDGGVSSDIWALGCTIIELLTSTPPYWHQGSGVALFKMVEDPHPPFPPSITPVSSLLQPND